MLLAESTRLLSKVGIVRRVSPAEPTKQVLTYSTTDRIPSWKRAHNYAYTQL